MAYLRWIPVAAVAFVVSHFLWGGALSVTPIELPFNLPQRARAVAAEVEYTAAERRPPPAQPGTLSKPDLRSLAAAAGCDDPDTMAAIAIAESSGRSDAVGDGGQSIGLWQIHMPSHPQYSRAELLDPARNAEAACAIAGQGRRMDNWTTHRNGAYRRHQ